MKVGISSENDTVTMDKSDMYFFSLDERRKGLGSNWRELEERKVFKVMHAVEHRWALTIT